MRILFVGAGRRVSFSRYFKDDEIFSYESDYKVPISKVSKIIIGKKWNDGDIYDHIIEVCSQNKIDLVIPLMDAATTICSKIKDKINCPTSDYSVNEICLNKKIFEKYMIDNFKEYYPYVDDNESEVVVKPFMGFGSKDIRYFQNVKNANITDNDVIQKKIYGKEYSVDCYFNKSNSMEDAISRRRDRVSGGEVISSSIDYKSKLIDVTKLIGEKMRLVGPCCFQYILDKNDNPYLFEINARFGGGCTLSLYAGFDIPSLIKRDFIGLTYKYIPNKWKRNVIMERYSEDTFYEA